MTGSSRRTSWYVVDTGEEQAEKRQNKVIAIIPNRIRTGNTLWITPQCIFRPFQFLIELVFTSNSWFYSLSFAYVRNGSQLRFHEGTDDHRIDHQAPSCSPCQLAA